MDKTRKNQNGKDPNISLRVVNKRKMELNSEQIYSLSNE